MTIYVHCSVPAFGIRSRISLCNQLLNQLDAALTPPECSNFISRQGAYLHVGSGLIFPHLRNGFRAALAEVCGQRFEERLID